MVTHQLQIRCRPGTDVLPLSYTTNYRNPTGLNYVSMRLHAEVSNVCWTLGSQCFPLVTCDSPGVAKTEISTWGIFVSVKFAKKKHFTGFNTATVTHRVMY